MNVNVKRVLKQMTLIAFLSHTEI